MPADVRRKFLGIIVAETERLSRLVNQVLDLAKIESGHGEWRIANVNLHELAQRAATAFEHALAERGTVLELDLAEGLPAAQADPDRLLQVLTNLLANAAKFVPSPGGRISLALRGDARGATFSVRDNGAGVAPAQQALIFEKFRQGGDARHRPAGTGLGLPISRQIVEHFGGRLWLESAPGAGATFSFTLPWQAEGVSP